MSYQGSNQDGVEITGRRVDNQDAKLKDSSSTRGSSTDATRKRVAAAPVKTPIQLVGDEVVNSIGMKLRRISPGEFMMGGKKTPAQLARLFARYNYPIESKFTGARNRGMRKGAWERRERAFLDENPAHNVTLTRPFYIDSFEVTNQQFNAFVTNSAYVTEVEKRGNGSGWDDREKKYTKETRFTWRHSGGDHVGSHPVTNISWNDAVAFCDWLSTKENVKYRLPTEAEWEFCCRAGSDTEYCIGDNPESLPQVGNVLDKDSHTWLRPDWRFYSVRQSDGFSRLAPIGSFAANDWGLFDMHGNVSEWCLDYYGEYGSAGQSDPTGPASGENRVIRGGGFSGNVEEFRSSKRSQRSPETADYATGFRVVAEISDLPRTLGNDSAKK